VNSLASFFGGILRHFEHLRSQEASSFRSNYPWALICLTACLMNLDNCYGKLQLPVNDIQNESQYLIQGGDYLRLNQISEIFNFVDSYKDRVDFFLFTCNNGNVSSAMSAAFSYIYFKNIDPDFTKQTFNIQVYRQMLRYYYSNI
jgi:predicted protein tyrosine phosphatase